MVLKLFVVSLLVVVGVLGLAGSASAQEVPAEVIYEPTGTHCPAVSGTGSEATGGCQWEAHAEMTLGGHLFGIEATASSCRLELTLVIGEEGEGWVVDAVFSQHDPPESPECTREACQEVGHAMEGWPFHIRETGSGAFERQVEFCIVGDPAHATAGEQRCQITFAISSIGHSYSHSPLDVGGTAHEGPRCELTGQTGFEAGLELSHLHPS